MNSVDRAHGGPKGVFSMPRWRWALAAAAAAVVLAVAFWPDRPSEDVQAWAADVYRPALIDIHDPDLAPWQPPQSRPRDPEAMRAGCAEALRRHDHWDGRLRDVDDERLARSVSAYISGERQALADCAATGGPPPPSSLLADVVKRLRQLGVDIPQG